MSKAVWIILAIASYLGIGLLVSRKIGAFYGRHWPQGLRPRLQEIALCLYVVSTWLPVVTLAPLVAALWKRSRAPGSVTLGSD
jgi:hypothetical protein